MPGYKGMSAWSIRSLTPCRHEDVPLVEFMYLALTRQSGESYRTRLRSLLLYLCEVFPTLINFSCVVILHERSGPRSVSDPCRQPKTGCPWQRRYKLWRVGALGKGMWEDDCGVRDVGR